MANSYNDDDDIYNYEQIEALTWKKKTIQNEDENDDTNNEENDPWNQQIQTNNDDTNVYAKIEKSIWGQPIQGEEYITNFNQNTFNSSDRTWGARNNKNDDKQKNVQTQKREVRSRDNKNDAGDNKYKSIRNEVFIGETSNSKNDNISDSSKRIQEDIINDLINKPDTSWFDNAKHLEAQKKKNVLNDLINNSSGDRKTHDDINDKHKNIQTQKRKEIINEFDPINNKLDRVRIQRENGKDDANNKKEEKQTLPTRKEKDIINKFDPVNESDRVRENNKNVHTDVNLYDEEERDALSWKKKKEHYSGNDEKEALSREQKTQKKEIINEFDPFSTFSTSDSVRENSENKENNENNENNDNKENKENVENNGNNEKSENNDVNEDMKKKGWRIKKIFDDEEDEDQVSNPDGEWLIPPRFSVFDILGEKKMHLKRISELTNTHMTYNKHERRIEIWGSDVDEAIRQWDNHVDSLSGLPRRPFKENKIRESDRVESDRAKPDRVRPAPAPATTTDNATDTDIATDTDTVVDTDTSIDTDTASNKHVFKLNRVEGYLKREDEHYKREDEYLNREERHLKLDDEHYELSKRGEEYLNREERHLKRDDERYERGRGEEYLNHEKRHLKRDDEHYERGRGEECLNREERHLKRDDEHFERGRGEEYLDREEQHVNREDEQFERGRGEEYLDREEQHVKREDEHFERGRGEEYLDREYQHVKREDEQFERGRGEEHLKREEHYLKREEEHLKREEELLKRKEEHLKREELLKREEYLKREEEHLKREEEHLKRREEHLERMEERLERREQRREEHLEHREEQRRGEHLESREQRRGEHLESREQHRGEHLERWEGRSENSEQRKEEHLERKEEQECDTKNYLKNPENPRDFPFSGYFVFPTNTEIRHILGAKDEALNPLRTKFKCHIWYEPRLPGSNVIRIVGNSKESVETATIRVENLFIKTIASKSVPVGDYHMVEHPHDEPFEVIITDPPSRFYLLCLPYFKPSVKLLKPVREIALDFDYDIYHIIRESNLERIQDSLNKALGIVHLFNEEIKMRIRFGHVCFTRVPLPKGFNEDMSLTISQLDERVLKKARTESVFATRIATEKRKFNGLFDVLSSDNELTGSPFREFKIRAIRRVEFKEFDIQFMKEESSDGEEIGLWNATIHERDVLNINMSCLDNDYSWKLNIKTAKRLPTEEKCPQGKFINRLRTCERGNLIYSNTYEILVTSVCEKTKWKYWWNGEYIVEITRYEYWEVKYLGDVETEYRLSEQPSVISYGVTLYKKSWDDKFALNPHLDIGEAPEWHPHDIMDEEQTGGVNGLLNDIRDFLKVLEGTLPVPAEYE